MYKEWSRRIIILHQPGFSGNSQEIFPSLATFLGAPGRVTSLCQDAASLKTQGFMDTTRTLSTAWKPLVQICWKWALLVKQKDHRSYGQNLVHGEGTSLSRVGPYRFLQWRHLVQTWGPHDPLNTTLVIPNFVRYSSVDVWRRFFWSFRICRSNVNFWMSWCTSMNMSGLLFFASECR